MLQTWSFRKKLLKTCSPEKTPGKKPRHWDFINFYLPLCSKTKRAYTASSEQILSHIFLYFSPKSIHCKNFVVGAVFCDACHTSTSDCDHLRILTLIIFELQGLTYSKYGLLCHLNYLCMEIYYSKYNVAMDPRY